MGYALAIGRATAADSVKVESRMVRRCGDWEYLRMWFYLINIRWVACDRLLRKSFSVLNNCVCDQKSGVGTTNIYKHVYSFARRKLSKAY